VSGYIPYNPEQDWLLPPSVREELGPDHLVFFLHHTIERLDVRALEGARSEEGRPKYAPQLLLKVWLYAYTQGLTSSRRIEQRLHEDLGFRFLAANLKPDHWTLNEFRKRHPRGLNDVFTQVVEAARKLGLGQLGRVAIDSTRVQANASADRSATQQQLRRERARIRQRIRRWQKQCDQDDPSTHTAAEVEGWRERLDQIPRQLEQLRKSGQKRSSHTDPESRYLRRRGGFVLGYNAEIAVTDDHLIVAQRVHQSNVDNASLEVMAAAVERECGAPPGAVVADCGYYAMEQIQMVEARGIEVYVPDVLSARELAGTGPAVEMNGREQRRHPGLKQLRQRMREPAARACYARRKAMVEPVFGVLKQQRGMRQFRRRGLSGVATEWALATTAFNLTRMFAQQRSRSR
jgi:transposase